MTSGAQGRAIDHNCGPLSMVAQEQGESESSTFDRAKDYVNGNPTAHGIYSMARGPSQRRSSEDQRAINVDYSSITSSAARGYLSLLRGHEAAMRAGVPDRA